MATPRTFTALADPSTCTETEIVSDHLVNLLNLPSSGTFSLSKF